jgi:hypothetical protein
LSTGFPIAGALDGEYSSSPSPTLSYFEIPFFFRAQVNSTRAMVILDTGLTTTIVHRCFLEKLSHTTFTPIRASYSSANCSLLDIIGEVMLDIRINGISTSIKAAVATDLVTDVLLGTDWTSRCVVLIHIHDRNLVVKDHHGSHTTNALVQPPDSSSSTISLVHSVTIPPYSESTASVHASKSGQSDLLLEASFTFAQKQIHVPDSLLHVRKDRSRLLLLNTTDRPYTLSQHTCLGITSQCRIIGGSSLSSVTHSRHDSATVSYCCYVCNRTFISNNDLHRHLRETCFPSDFRIQIERLTQHISNSRDRTKIQVILWRHGKLFDIRTPLKINTTLENATDTGKHRPAYTPPYGRSLHDHQAIDIECEILLHHDRIEPSVSPWCSPVVLVRKKDSSTRFCLDYRKLNEITAKDSFPLPRLDDIFY